jgi:photosystem II stability/assembly factor-like uncharacterized protein
MTNSLLRHIALGLALLTISSGVQAQFRWHVAHSDNDSTYFYSFRAVSSDGLNCTVSGIKYVNSPPSAQIMFFRSNDGGFTWTEQDPHLPVEKNSHQNHIVKVQQIDSLNVVAIGNTGLIVKTTNGGATWKQLQLNTTYDFFDVHFSDPMTGIVIANGLTNVFTTMDGGEHWKSISINSILPPKQGHSYGNGKFFVFTSAGPRFTTSDNFETIDSSLTIYPLTDNTHNLLFSNFLGIDTIVAYGTFDSDQTYGIITRSLDGGKNWSDSYRSLDLSAPLCMSSLSVNPVLLGGYSPSLVAVSWDHGVTWETDTVLFDAAFTTSYIMGLTVLSNGNAIGVTYNSVFEGSDGEIIVGTPVSEVTNSHESPLYSTQLYPNPATTNVNIASSYGMGTIHLYDVLGREALVGIVSSGQTTLDVSKLPRGIYSVVLEHDGNLLPAGKIAVQ